ncbi:MAG: hypothetical protein Kow00107_09480 [Planctomycetota bacterium]
MVTISVNVSLAPASNANNLIGHEVCSAIGARKSGGEISKEPNCKVLLRNLRPTSSIRFILADLTAFAPIGQAGALALIKKGRPVDGPSVKL